MKLFAGILIIIFVFACAWLAVGVKAVDNQNKVEEASARLRQAQAHSIASIRDSALKNTEEVRLGELGLYEESYRQ